MEVQLWPLIDQVNRVKDLRAPEFGSRQEWQGGKMFVGQTKIEVPFDGNSTSSKDDDWVDWEEG